jgi:hypothetical protein
MIHARAVVVAAAIVMAPLGAWGADLVMCWQKGFCAPQCEAISEIVAAFEQGIGKGLDCRAMDLENEVAKAIVAVRDAKRRLASSIRSNQAKVSSGHDDTNNKTFFDYEAAVRVKEAQNALDRLTTTQALQERGYALKEIKLIQQATLHGSSGGKRARERAKQAHAQLDMLSQRCVAEGSPAMDLESLTGNPTAGSLALGTALLLSLPEVDREGTGRTAVRVGRGLAAVACTRRLACSLLDPCSRRRLGQ